jgi:hypothetical protein
MYDNNNCYFDGSIEKKEFEGTERNFMIILVATVFSMVE